MGFYHHKQKLGGAGQRITMGFSPPEVGNTSDIPSEKYIKIHENGGWRAFL